MQNGIASHLHFLTDVQGNMYTYVSHLRYHANDEKLKGKLYYSSL